MMIRQIVAGVDATKEGVFAAELGQGLADRFNGSCRLVHATMDTAAVSWIPSGIEPDELMRQLTAGAREVVTGKLDGKVSAAALADMDVMVGPAGVVLDSVADATHADLVVLGGRRRSAASRWLEGSTIKHVVRRGRAPVLVGVPPVSSYRRILVPVDLSDMMRPTIETAMQFGKDFGADVQVIFAIEPLPFEYGAMIHNPAEYMDEAGQEFNRRLDEMHLPDLDRVTVYGSAARMISKQVNRWNADLVVLGSHGKGMVDRVLLGSTTSRIINELPASLFIVPAAIGTRGVAVGEDAAAVTAT